MAKARGSGDRGDAADRPQDPLVERLRPDPSQPPEPARTLEGLLGDSDRPGFRRLYFTSELDYYAEFRSEDVLSVADIPADQPPFLGEPATRVTLRRDAPVDFTKSQRTRPLDEFDLDVRLAGAGPGAAAAEQPLTFGEPGCLETYGFGCQEPQTLATFIDCPIYTEACTVQCPTAVRTCFTCPTDCQRTCYQTCYGRTCGPTCGGTCLTCDRTCSPTCTCRPTCRPTCFTCGPGCNIPTQVGYFVTRRCEIGG